MKGINGAYLPRKGGRCPKMEEIREKSIRVTPGCYRFGFWQPEIRKATEDFLVMTDQKISIQKDEEFKLY